MESGDVLEGIFQNFLTGPQLFANRHVLRNDYIPSTLPHRAEHIQRLGAILAPALSGSKISNLFVYGKTGTGKTIVAKFVLERLKKKAEDVGAPVRVSYVNCRMAGSNYRVLADLCRCVGVEIPFTGLALGVRDDVLRAVQELKPVAADLGLSMAQLAVAWVLQNDAVSAAIISSPTLWAGGSER